MKKQISQHILQENRMLEELHCARQSIQDQHVRITSQEDNFKKLNDIKKELEKKCEIFLLEASTYYYIQNLLLTYTYI